MLIKTKVIERINKAIIDAHLKEDRKSIEILERSKMNYLKRWLK
jgi:hypothetical protein